MSAVELGPHLPALFPLGCWNDVQEKLSLENLTVSRFQESPPITLAARFGRYSVTLAATYGSSGETLSARKTLWVVPWRMQGWKVLLTFACIAWVIAARRRFRRAWYVLKTGLPPRDNL